MCESSALWRLVFFRLALFKIECCKKAFDKSESDKFAPVRLAREKSNLYKFVSEISAKERSVCVKFAANNFDPLKSEFLRLAFQKFAFHFC